MDTNFFPHLRPKRSDRKPAGGEREEMKLLFFLLCGATAKMQCPGGGGGSRHRLCSKNCPPEKKRSLMLLPFLFLPGGIYLYPWVSITFLSLRWYENAAAFCFVQRGRDLSTQYNYNQMGGGSSEWVCVRYSRHSSVMILPWKEREREREREREWGISRPSFHLCLLSSSYFAL